MQISQHVMHRWLGFFFIKINIDPTLFLKQVRCPTRNPPCLFTDLGILPVSLYMISLYRYVDSKALLYMCISKWVWPRCLSTKLQYQLNNWCLLKSNNYPLCLFIQVAVKIVIRDMAELKNVVNNNNRYYEQMINTSTQFSYQNKTIQYLSVWGIILESLKTVYTAFWDLRITVACRIRQRVA